jgi:hypothetical protein
VLKEHDRVRDLADETALGCIATFATSYGTAPSGRISHAGLVTA